MQTIDAKYADLAPRVMGQALSVSDAFSRIEDPEGYNEDYPDDAVDLSLAPELLQGVCRGRDGRAYLIFQSEDTPRERRIVYVDAILELAALINRERVIPMPEKHVPSGGKP